MIPRIRARTGQGDDGKYYFEISVWEFDGETQIGEPIGPFGPYDTEAKAKEEMRRACRMACEQAEILEIGKPTGKYLDLKNGGKLRSWDEN